jgi:hypothetical protein
MKSLAETFAAERANLEGQVNQSDQASTENLRVALRNYRSFFQRLLSLWICRSHRDSKLP